MSLSLTTRRKQQTLSAKWSTQQHLGQHHQNTDITATNANLFRHHHSNYLNNQPVRKQKSFIETLHLNKTVLTAQTGRAYLSRGLSVGRAHDIQRASYTKEGLRKHSSIIADSYNGRNDPETLRAGNLIKRNNIRATTSEHRYRGGEFLRNSRGVQVWSSTASILKSLDKELAQLNGVVGKCKDVKVFKDQGASTADNVKTNKLKAESALKTNTQSSHSNRSKQIKTEVNKVNLNIVLSHALDPTKDDNDCVFSSQEVDEEDGYETSSDSGKNMNSAPKFKDNKKTEQTSSSLRPTLLAQQRRALYQANSSAANLALINNNSNNSSNTTALKPGIQNSQNFNASPSLTVQKRPPLIRAMSAPVRSFDERAKSSASLLNSKRKSRRRKLNTRDISCDKGSCDLLSTKNVNFDPKAKINKKVLTRSKSVATDVVTLVSLISSEGSDSEKEDSSLALNNSHTGSPNRRAPSLRKTGKSVSFQENYPPTFQFASKEYSHMLRRGSIAPLSQRIKSNRPPTAPAGSIYHNAQKPCDDIPAAKTEPVEETKSVLEDIKSTVSNTLSETMKEKPLEEEYDYPEYVRSLKERECWKLFMKMSTKGVNISYDTILRGMLTPTEFRQLQKQREIEEAKSVKETVDNSLIEETPKRPPTAIERLKESLLKN